jgi:hypothetical protein
VSIIRCDEASYIPRQSCYSETPRASDIAIRLPASNQSWTKNW